MAAIPFSIKHLYAGLAEAEGLTYLEHETLVLEYCVKDFTKSLSSSVKEVRLDLREVETVQLHESLWRRPRLCVRMQSLAALRRLPHTQGEVALCIPRAAKNQARRLANRLTLLLSEYKLEWLEHEHRRLEREAG